jgi:hypothetical protein
VIVRIMAEGQYRLDESFHHRLDELDDAVVARVEAKDEAGYDSAFAALLAFVRDNGEKVAGDDLETSDFMLPPPDLSFDEAGEQFTGEGLIPDPAGAPAAG